MKGYVKRDEEGKIIIDNNGFITITCEDESVVFQLHLSEIDDKAEQMCFNVNDKDIYIDIYPGWETTEADTIAENETENETINENENENDNENENEIENENDNETEKENDSENYKLSTPSTSKTGNTVFPWCDASTKIFLKEYKLKKELVKNRKLKNMKLAYQEISKKLQDNGFNVSPLQVENRFKTLKRAYKNMIISNRRTGRGRYICSYEQDLDEIFSARHLVPELHGVSEMDVNGEDNLDGIEYSQNIRNNQSQNSFMRNSTFSVESLHNYSKNNLNESSRLEAQYKKIVDSLQSCQRALKTLISKMESRSRNSNDVQLKLLQIYMEMRDMQKEAYTRAEEQRLQASAQREKTNSLLQQIITLLQIKKDT